MGTVYVVHCIDTEGPLYEDQAVIFEQIKKIFGITIHNTQENYDLLKEGKMDCGDKTQGIRTLFENLKTATKGSWSEINAMLENITAEKYRKKLPDAAGNGWIYNWFCMDHVGFWGENPRRRDAGHHKIFDHYEALVQNQKSGDLIQFHHHPVSFSGNYNDSGTAYWGRNTLNEILARKIIDRLWFPSVYRPGFHTERPDSNWFLEQWIPFDYGNQATGHEEYSQADLSNGRFGNWQYAPKEWVPYHPDHDDYQKKGRCRRWITRCLNMKTRVRELNQEDVDDAFRTASDGQDVILAFTDHDYKDMNGDIDKVRSMIADADKRYKKADFLYADALTAMRRVLKLTDKEIGLEMKLIFDRFPTGLEVTAENSIFGPQPFLAIKVKNGGYYWDNFDFCGKNKWSYAFDDNTFHFKEVEKLGIAANNSYGKTELIWYDCQRQIQNRKILNR